MARDFRQCSLCGNHTIRNYNCMCMCCDSTAPLPLRYRHTVERVIIAVGLMFALAFVTVILTGHVRAQDVPLPRERPGLLEMLNNSNPPMISFNSHAVALLVIYPDGVLDFPVEGLSHEEAARQAWEMFCRSDLHPPTRSTEMNVTFSFGNVIHQDGAVEFGKDFKGSDQDRADWAIVGRAYAASRCVTPH